MVENDETEITKREPDHYIDFDLTIKDVICKIEAGFPKNYKECEESDFILNSRKFVNTLLHSPDKLETLLSTLPSVCSYCSLPLEDWKHKNPKSYFITMGHLKQISIKLKVCPTCRRAFYPDFYCHGIIFVHNKIMVAIETILDYNHIMQTGGGFIEAIKKKIGLLGQLEGIPNDVLKPDAVHLALKMDKMVIAVLSIIVKGSDFDDVLCYICGNCPKIVCTDGNTKVRHFLVLDTTSLKYKNKTYHQNKEHFDPKGVLEITKEKIKFFKEHGASSEIVYQ